MLYRESLVSRARLAASAGMSPILSSTEKPIPGTLRNANRHEYWWISPLTGFGFVA
jgi:hypothetical protein